MSNIILKNISKSYYNNEIDLNIFKNLNLEIDTDEITVLLGKSGCGKTTLLRMLAQLEDSDFGEIIFPENFVDSYVFQEPRLMPWLNVEDNITLGVKELRDENKIMNLLNLILLDKFRYSFPNELSGGMKQRVSIARALAMDPNYIYMDEPFAALDYFTRRAMQKEVLKLFNIQKCGVLFVTHNIDEALILAHRILIIDNGEIIEDIDLSNMDFPRSEVSNLFVEKKKLILEYMKEE